MTQATRIAIAVVEHGGRYLIGRRPEGVPLAGLWEFPGGKIRTAETPEEAAVRECFEETGIEVVVRGEYAAIRQQYDYGCLDLRFFDCSPRDPRQAPADPFRWVVAAELTQYEFPEANSALVNRLAQSASTSS